MTDEKVKEAVERLTEFAEAVDWQPTDTCTINGRTISCEDLRAILAHCDALQAERDKLAAENVRLASVAGDYNNGRLASEAKLTALVEAVNGVSALVEIGRISEQARFQRMSLPDYSIEGHIGLDRLAAAYAAFTQALAHHSAPVGEDNRARIDALLGDADQRRVDEVKAELATTPTSAPVEDVGGLMEGDLEWISHELWTLKYTWINGRPDRARHNARIDRILAALSPALIQPQGEERS